MRLRTPLGLALIALIALAAPAAAKRGVAVDLGAIEIDHPLAAGGVYRLPTMAVRNPGDEQGRYVMGVGQTGQAGVSPLDPAWFAFTPAEFELAPGQSVPVTISMRLPRDVAPADYEGLLRAELRSEGQGALVGAAAAARLTFEVAPSSTAEALIREVAGLLAGVPVVVWAALVVVAGLVVLAWLSRRFDLRIERRR